MFEETRSGALASPHGNSGSARILRRSLVSSVFTEAGSSQLLGAANEAILRNEPNLCSAQAIQGNP